MLDTNDKERIHELKIEIETLEKENERLEKQNAELADSNLKLRRLTADEKQKAVCYECGRDRDHCRC